MYHTFIDDATCWKKDSRITGGYNSIGFFAPDPQYAAEPPIVCGKFKEMVDQTHEGGLEVILDVVYNHTPKGNERAPPCRSKYR